MNTAGRKQSARLFARAKRILPGGVDSPVRAFLRRRGHAAVHPAGERRARIEDEDGRSYVDFVMSWGPLIHGHAPAGLTRVLAAAARSRARASAPRRRRRWSLGTEVRGLMPSLESGVRFVNSGTEAAMSALRLARAATGAEPGDQVRGVLSRVMPTPFLVQAGSGATHPRGPHQPGGIAGGGGPTPSSRATTTSDRSTGCSARQPRSGGGADRGARGRATWAWSPPRPGFLEGMRALCDEHGAILIFDEVISGFRSAGPRRRAGAVRGPAPTSPASARSSAGGCRSAPTGGGAT